MSLESFESSRLNDGVLVSFKEVLPTPTAAKRGSQFYRELLRFVSRFKRQMRGGGRFYRGLVDGSVSRAQLIGYALEYYHIVNLCPDLLAPALSQQESRRTREMLHRFFVSELRHDDMLEHSLKAVGIPREVLHRMLPLPATFALCSSLSTYARQHTLSFKAALFLFENPGIEFNAAFKQHCETLGMPSGFYTPILHHATLNHEGAHEDITAELLEDVPCISVEDQQVVLRHTACLIEIMFHQEHQILDYYGQPNSVMPRCFD